eukprot:m.263069 g.263069  ORF g.263069 m.263069 type:complete len:423 (+) comp48404_c0_seq1:27-1295(+)
MATSFNSMLRVLCVAGGIAATTSSSSSASPRLSSSSTALDLVKVVDRNHRGAACLDGSPPGYFIRRGVQSTKFILHAQGGGWCWDTPERADDDKSCHDRANTGLGSSKFWTSSPPSTGSNWYCCDGILSGNATENPLFHDWTMVFINYCDGSSFTGNRNNTFNGLHYRGRANLDAVLDDLIAKEQLSTATQVVWTGGSAGGLAVYLNADHVASRLPGVDVKALADGGFFLDHLTMGGVEYDRQVFSEGSTDLWQSVHNPACLAANPAWKCAFAQYTLPHIAIPVYVVEGMYDPWQLEFTLQLGGGPPHGPAPTPKCLAEVWSSTWDPYTQCSAAQISSMMGFGHDMFSNVTAALQPKDSAFVPACPIHCQTILTTPWTTWTLQNQRLPYHFHAWLVNGSTAAPPLIDRRTYPNNADCAHHGS